MNMSYPEVQIPEIVMYWAIKIIFNEIVFLFPFKFNLVQYLKFLVNDEQH